MRFLWLCVLLCGLSAWANPGVVAKVEYFYAPDGTLTGRAINGVRQNFEYDLRGQLLAVKDASGKDLERYVYDHVGNILSKTVNGKTTTYTYDKANQLVTSTCDGKTTHYRYDAAGRLVQEGDKKYLYRYQDKVASVWENGQQLANFDYFIDGQVAKATYGAAMEEFLWDDLALIRRGGTTFLNEPYITGGNPVMANDAVMFNDMLGNTLGIQNATGFAPVAMTAFGETADASAFFTGKPSIPELGYAFLFRNYRAEQGKWQTIDPLGYPDGWNNLAYCNNGVVNAIDWLGAEVRLCQRSLFYSDNLINHTWLDLVPDKPSDFSQNTQLNPPGSPRNRGTVSGMPDGSGGSSGSVGPNGSGGGDNLISSPNADIGYSNNDGSNFIVIPTPAGMTDTQFIQGILAAQNRYDNNNPLPYAALPIGGTYNSNSFIAGLLNSLGFNGVQLVQSLPGTQPGAGNPVPARRFE